MAYIGKGTRAATRLAVLSVSGVVGVALACGGCSTGPVPMRSPSSAAPSSKRSMAGAKPSSACW